MQTATLEYNRMEHFIHIAVDRLGLAGWSSVFLTMFTIAEWGLVLPMVMTVAMAIAQGYRWNVDNKRIEKEEARKQERHELYVSLMENMVEKMKKGEIPYDKSIIDRLAAEDAD